VGQFVAGRTAPVAPDSWSRRYLSGWILRSEQSLPVVPLLDDSGASVGWLLGQPIDIASRMIVTGDLRIPASAGDPDFERRFQTWLYEHGGRFVAILLVPHPRVYCDVFGSLPVYFRADSGRVSSSPFLLFDPDEPVADSPLVDVVDPFGTSQYYPFAETGHRDALRLLPSHELDLDAFTARRVWPSEPFPPVDPGAAVELVGSIVEATIEAASKSGDVAMGLTAGGDSRMMVACAKRLVDKLSLFTLAFHDMMGQADLATASMLAQQFGLRWRRVPWVEGDDTDARLWYYRTGAVCGESRGRSSVRTYDQLAGEPKPIRVSGIGVELSRGYAWNRGLKRGEAPDTPHKVLRGEDLLARVSLRRHPMLAEAAERWLEGLPALSALDTIDLCALETTHGAWAGPVTLGHPDAFATTIFPFAHRTILDTVLGLPHDYRRAGRLRREIVASRWPELGAVPVNHIPASLRLKAKARRYAQAPGGAVRRIRRRSMRRRG
jgi:hypothetical protein